MILLRSVWSRIDTFLAAILLTVAFAAVMPARGDAGEAVSWLADGAIVLLFFMHGAKLSPEEALVGARHWRLHVWCS
jgi:solute carrier family 10 (sodium/bile acid cotransporter), member 7